MWRRKKPVEKETRVRWEHADYFDPYTVDNQDGDLAKHIRQCSCGHFSKIQVDIDLSQSPEDIKSAVGRPVAEAKWALMYETRGFYQPCKNTSKLWVVVNVNMDPQIWNQTLYGVTYDRSNADDREENRVEEHVYTMEGVVDVLGFDAARKRCTMVSNSDDARNFFFDHKDKCTSCLEHDGTFDGLIVRIDLKRPDGFWQKYENHPLLEKL